MIDKIQGNIPAGYTNNVNRVSREYATPQTETRQAGNPSAEVSISSDAIALQKSLKAAQDTPEIRTDIVNAIQDQLNAGTYRVDTNALAEKLLPFMK